MNCIICNKELTYAHKELYCENNNFHEFEVDFFYVENFDFENVEHENINGIEIIKVIDNNFYSIHYRSYNTDIRVFLLDASYDSSGGAGYTYSKKIYNQKYFIDKNIIDTSQELLNILEKIVKLKSFL